MTPQSAKNKGRLLQQKVVKTLLKHFNELEDDDVKSTSMGAPGEDILLSPKARTVFPFSIEAKSRNKHQVYRFYEQARDNAKGKHEPLVVIKENGKDPLAVVDFELFVCLIKDHIALHEIWDQRSKESTKAALLRSKNVR